MKLHSTNAIQAARIGYILSSAALLVIGALIFFNPEASLMTLGVAVGIVLMAFGVVKLIGYWSKDLYRLAFQYDLAFGILLIILSILALTRTHAVMSIASMILGIVILADALFKIQIAIDAKSFGLPRWWLIFVLAVFSGIAGGMMMFHPWESAAAVSRLIGLAIAAEGALNLSTVLCAVKIVRNQIVTDPEERRDFWREKTRI